ncbi:MAG: deoxyribonuclease V [Thermodesulfobacteriota bacterium]|nr:deoxyribonuclease V [Thermodesulfobacteriota bacterium]
MKVRNLHNWNADYKTAKKIQEELSGRLILHNEGLPEDIKIIGGADISYSRGENLFFAAVILLEFSTMDIIEVSSVVEKVDFPYIPGLLTFREGPALLRAFEKIGGIPDVVIFDGQGIAHPRGIGLASHIGLFLDIPTIGCAKKRLVGIHGEIGTEVGDFSHLTYHDRVVGAVLRTKRNVKPVFISQGHKIDLEQAIEITLASSRGYRLPEPTRRAHLTVNKLRLEHKG